MLVENSTFEWVLIQGFIYYFRYLGLLCLLYFYLALSIGGVRAIAHPASIVIEAIGAIEILWYLFWFLPYRHYLQTRRAVFPSPLSRAQRKALFTKALVVNSDAKLYMMGWMCGAHLDEIRRENVKDWLLWALFDREGPPGYDEEELEEYVTQMEEKHGWTIESGRGPAKPLRLNFDRLDISHRSLAYYLMLGQLDFTTTISLQLLGFKFYRQPRSAFFKSFPLRPMTLLAPSQSAAPNFSYFFRPHRSTKHRPIVLAHGLGVGLIAYLPLIMLLPKDVGILAIEILPISSRITSPLPLAIDMQREFGDIITQQDLKNFVFVGHSYGTFLTNQYLKSPLLASRMHSMVLLDPVALLLHLPDVAYNFTKRTPITAGDWELWYAARSEPNIAFTLGRCFCWREHVIWREELLSRKTTVILAEKDVIVPAPSVTSYLTRGDLDAHWEDHERWKTTCSWDSWTGSGLEIVYLEGYNHGQAFLSPKMLPKIVDVINKHSQIGYGIK